MGDARLLAKVDAFIQDHLLEVSEQEDFLKLPRLKVSLNIIESDVEEFWSLFVPVLKLVGANRLNKLCIFTCLTLTWGQCYL